MCSLIRFLFIGIACATFIPTQSHAQFQLNVMGSRGIPVELGASLRDGVWGTGASLRYFTSPNLAIGLNVRYFAQRNSYAFGQASTTSRNQTIIVTGQVDYFFTKSRLQPYVGAEAGLYAGNYRSEFISPNSPPSMYSGTSRSFGVSPKAGLQYLITSSAGVNVDVGYHYVFDGSDSHAAILNAGGFLKFGRR